MIELLVLFSGFISGAGIFLGTDDNDDIRGSDGSDTIDGRDGDDRIRSLDGNDFLTGGDGDDILIGNTGNDVLDGGDGNDRLFGGRGFDEVNGGDGDDYLKGFYGGDTLNGGEGDDILDGGAWNDKLIGGLGSDVLIGGDGDDIIRDLGIGDDSSLSDEALAERATILDERYGDHLPEEARGSSSQLFFGDDGNDRIAAYASGADTLAWGGTGDDIIEGISQAWGGLGDDVIEYEAEFSDISLHGNQGDDIITAKGENILVKGGDGDDRITATGTSDAGGTRVSGGNGDDVIDVIGHPESSAFVNAGTGNDFIHVGEDSTVVGSQGNDTFFVTTEPFDSFNAIADFNPDEDVLMLDANRIASMYDGLSPEDVVPENLVFTEIETSENTTDVIMSVQLPGSETSIELCILGGLTLAEIDVDSIISVDAETDTDAAFEASVLAGDIDAWTEKTGWTLSKALRG